MWCVAALRIMGRKIFFSFLAVSWKPSFAPLVFNLSTVSVPVYCFFSGRCWYDVVSG